MIYCITGGTGLVGRAVQKELEAQGHEVRILTRTPRKPGEFAWNPAAHSIDPAALHGARGVIHLAGALVSERWTKSHQRAIMDSRIQGAETLFSAIEAMDQRPEVMVSASAVGIYPNSLDRVYTELDGGAKGFLGDVVRAWESQADRFTDLGLRVAKIRIGIVLGHGGGVLGTLLPLFASDSEAPWATASTGCLGFMPTIWHAWWLDWPRIPHWTEFGTAWEPSLRPTSTSAKHLPESSASPFGCRLRPLGH